VQIRRLGSGNKRRPVVIIYFAIQAERCQGRNRGLRGLRVDPRADEPVIGLTVVAGEQIPIQRFVSMPPNVNSTGDIGSMALLAGQTVGLVDEIRTAADILRETVNGAEQLIHGLSAKALSMRA